MLQLRRHKDVLDSNDIQCYAKVLFALLSQTSYDCRTQNSQINGYGYGYHAH